MLKQLYFFVEGELYQYDVQHSKLILPKHSSYITLPCQRIDVKTDGKLFKRLVLQIRARNISYNTLFTKLQSYNMHIKESGVVLAQAFQVAVSETRSPLADSPLLRYNASGFLRTEIVPRLNIYLQDFWSTLINV
jgi:hypothetical protein